MIANYSWNRFWHPSDDPPALTDDDFLRDRDSMAGRVYGTKLVTLHELSEAPCLTLLGEPGIGKSTEVALAYRAASETLPPQDAAMFVQLRDVDSRVAFREKVELADTFQEWRDGSHNLTLFLDSIDEGLLGFASLSSTLAEFLDQLPHDRLRLRLVSRTAEWPAELSLAIAAKWKKGATSLTLAPLREEDVRVAATANGLDAQRFLEEVLHRGAGALAARPVTLRLLLTIYAREGALPHSRAATYNRGCRLLAVEDSTTRKSARRVGSLDADRRLAIAGRIAFVLIFCNKSAVWTDTDSGDIPSSDVVLEALLKPRLESALGSNLTLTKQQALEVLHSALFTLRGPTRFSFAHQTFAEHLAAWYVAEHRPRWQQLRSLVFSKQGDVERVVPQLRETAARLAEAHPGVERRIAQLDPEVMLRSLDLGAVRSRAVLVRALLAETRRQCVPVSDDYTREALSRLKHPRLASQLTAVLNDKRDTPEARRFAADLAAACRLASLAEDLARVALDESEPFLLRYDVLVALVAIDSSAVNARLAPLALRPVKDDDYEQIKGMALSLVWPATISSEQLFEALTPPKRSSMYGPYQQFLDNLGPSLSRRDLPRALAWAAEHAVDGDHTGKCVASILLRAWEDLTDPDVLQGFSKIAYARLQNHNLIINDDREVEFGYHKRASASFADLLATDRERRQRLAAALLEQVAESRDVFTLMHSEPAILRPEDAEWLLVRFTAETHDDRRAVWLEALVRLFYHSGDPLRVYECIYPAAFEHEEIHQEFTDFVLGVELDSSRAVHMRESEASARRWQSKREKRPAYPPRQRDVVEYLTRFEAGDHDAWWHLCYYLARNQEGTQQDLHYVSIARQSGWTILDAPTQERLGRAALAYLHSHSPALGEWVGQNKLYQPDVSAIRALHLLFELGSDRLPPVQSAVWARWGPALVALTTYDNRDREIDRVLLSRALEAAPQAVLPALEQLIKDEDLGGHGIFVLARLDGAWEQVSPLLLRMLRARVLTPHSTEQLFVELLKRRIPQSEDVASSYCPWPIPSDDSERQLTIAAMQAILRSGSPLSYSLIWPRMNEIPALGQELLLSLAANRDWLIPDIMMSWGADGVARLYLWLWTEFPPSEDPHPEGVFSPWARYNIGHWRQQLLTALSNAGTWEAVRALELIHMQRPGLGHAHALRDAREGAWRAEWHPPAPSDALRMITRGDVRLVRNGDELVHLIDESLYRFQGALVGDTPLARLLWHKVPKGDWRPDDEGALADALALHLANDLKSRGIVAGREVVIRRGAGGLVPGSRTDITISAVTPGHDEHSFDTATVILEVKCSWNPDVLTALETQLVGDYLVNNQRASHGIYVVGWYASPAWDRTDRRRARSARTSIASLSKALPAQARRASQGGLHIVAGVLDVSLTQNIKRPRRLRRTVLTSRS
jgi:hypothetical protein